MKKVCKQKIPIANLEAIFVEQLKSYRLSAADMDSFLGRAQDTISEKQQMLHSLKGDLEKLSKEGERTHRLYLDDKITADEFGAIFRPIRKSASSNSKRRFPGLKPRSISSK